MSFEITAWTKIKSAWKTKTYIWKTLTCCWVVSTPCGIRGTSVCWSLRLWASRASLRACKRLLGWWRWKSIFKLKKSNETLNAVKLNFVLASYISSSRSSSILSRSPGGVFTTSAASIVGATSAASAGAGAMGASTGAGAVGTGKGPLGGGTGSSASTRWPQCQSWCPWGYAIDGPQIGSNMVNYQMKYYRIKNPGCSKHISTKTPESCWLGPSIVLSTETSTF